MKKLIFTAVVSMTLAACGPSVGELKEKALAGDRQALIDWAATDDAEGLYALGKAYLYDGRFSENSDSALMLLTKSADAGFDSAQCELGDVYSAGYYVDADLKKALEYYKKSAAQGNESGMVNAGYMLSGGSDLDADYNEAIKYYSQVKGDMRPSALYSVGVCYENLSDVPNAVKKYEEAAAAGYNSACTKLGALYLNNESVKDDAKSFEWYNKAIEAGDSYGYFAIGWFYENGRGGVEKDIEKAKEYYKQGADAGVADAVNAYNRLNPKPFVVGGHKYQGQASGYDSMYNKVTVNAVVGFYTSGKYYLTAGHGGRSQTAWGSYRQNGNTLSLYPDAGNGEPLTVKILDNGRRISGNYGLMVNGTLDLLN